MVNVDQASFSASRYRNDSRKLRLHYLRVSAVPNSDGMFSKSLVSGGTAGCVIAARLAEDADVNILLVEAGDHSDNVPQTKIPVG